MNQISTLLLLITIGFVFCNNSSSSESPLEPTLLYTFSNGIAFSALQINIGYQFLYRSLEYAGLAIEGVLDFNYQTDEFTLIGFTSYKEFDFYFTAVYSANDNTVKKTSEKLSQPTDIEVVDNYYSAPNSDIVYGAGCNASYMYSYSNLSIVEYNFDSNQANLLQFPFQTTCQNLNIMASDLGGTGRLFLLYLDEDNQNHILEYFTSDSTYILHDIQGDVPLDLLQLNYYNDNIYSLNQTSTSYEIYRINLSSYTIELIYTMSIFKDVPDTDASFVFNSQGYILFLSETSTKGKIQLTTLNLETLQTNSTYTTADSIPKDSGLLYLH